MTLKHTHRMGPRRICAGAVLSLSLSLAAAGPAAAGWVTGAGSPPAFSDEQVCRNGMVWRYADLRKNVTPQPASIRLEDLVVTDPPMEELEPEPDKGSVLSRGTYIVPRQELFVDPALVGGRIPDDFYNPGRIGFFDYSGIFTFEFKRPLPAAADSRIGVRWRHAPGQPYSRLRGWNYAVEDCHLIDAVPGAFPNDMAVGAELSVALLTTPKFDAGRVDARTARLAPGLPSAPDAGAGPLASQVIDVDGDRDRDLLLRFDPGRAGITCETTEVRLTGAGRGGETITGRDSLAPQACPPLQP